MSKLLQHKNLSFVLLASLLILSTASHPAFAGSDTSKDKPTNPTVNTSFQVITPGNGSTFVSVKNAANLKPLSSATLAASASYTATSPASGTSPANGAALTALASYTASGVANVTASSISNCPANSTTQAISHAVAGTNAVASGVSATQLSAAYIGSANTVSTAFTTSNMNQNLYMQQRISAFQANQAALSWAVTTRKPAINFQQKLDSIQNVAIKGLTKSASIRSAIVEPKSLKEITVASSQKTTFVPKKEKLMVSGQKAAMKLANQPILTSATQAGKLLTETVSKKVESAELTLQDIKKKGKDIVKSVQSRTSQAIKAFIQQKIIDAFVAFPGFALSQGTLLKAQATIPPSEMLLSRFWGDPDAAQSQQNNSPALPASKQGSSNQDYNPEIQGIVNSIADFDRGAIGLAKESSRIKLPVKDHFINNGLSPPSCQAIFHDTVIRDTVIPAINTVIHLDTSANHSLVRFNSIRLNYSKIAPLCAPASYLATKEAFSLLSDSNRLCERVSAKAVFSFLEKGGDL
ncbi:MAG TPA: hypothetical protein P5110_00955 [Candidatus Omnitrophota bacterium]|nr:hypothetical protein [Candidatus Omnitrophota bacterium]